MRRCIIFSALLFLSIQVFSQSIQERKKILINAIALRESSYNPDTFNINEIGSVGYLGISPIMVGAVNQIIGWNKYILEDRLSKSKSIEMFIIYQNKVNPHWYFENGCRAWNGGEFWWKKKYTTDKYWKDILDDGIIKQ